jgi:hypothetical protein
VTASSRPGRVGRAFADWFIGVAADAMLDELVRLTGKLRPAASTG